MKNDRYIMSKRGMVASAHTLVSSTGIEILRKNGSAMDAAVGMALTAGVVLPDMCGLGGDAFFLYYEAKTKKIYALNGSGPAGSNQSPEFFKQLKLSRIPEFGIHSMSVPGAVSAYFEGHRKFGTLSFNECAQDAIYYADHGFTITKRTSDYIQKKKSEIKKDTVLSKMFLTQEGNAKAEQSVVSNPQLAKTLRFLVQNEDTGFYSTLAKGLVERLNARGSSLISSDFEEYKAEWVEPIRINYRDHWVYQLPPVSQGIIHLEMLNILKNFDMERIFGDPAEAIHLMVEAKKIAFEDRISLFGDPKFIDNPMERVLSSSYGSEKAALIHKDSSIKVDLDLLNNKSLNTSSMVVVDQFGNACSFITSVNDAFGACIIDEETGIILNNRIGACFNMVEGHPNCIAPKKKTMNTLNAFLITDDQGFCRYVSNTPGGDRQPQWNAQTTVHLLDQKLNVIEALHEPYWFDAQTTNPYPNQIENVLNLEPGYSDQTIQSLKDKGHVIEMIERCNSALQLIEITKDNVYCGATDWRSEGVVIGF